MLIKNLDHFSRNIIIVFAGNTILNILSLFYQLLIAHKLTAGEFAAFNSLLALFMVVSSPLATIQLAVAKYSAQFYAHKQAARIKFFFSDLFVKIAGLSCLTLVIFAFFASGVVSLLKIPSVFSGYILALLVASSWFVPFFTGAVQGLERFKWLSTSNVVSGIAKLAFAFIFILLGLRIAGALGALLLSSLCGLLLLYWPVRELISLRPEKEQINYKEILIYLFPVALSNFCFMTLSTSDMVLVKYYFAQEEAGIYALAQMVGKIFLFLPGAISMVMFPRSTHLNAKNMETQGLLRRSLFYAGILCAAAALFYNLCPAFVLKALTGKAIAESLRLGRFFSLSMSLFTLSFILITYFLSIKDLRFIKFLAGSLALQVLAIALIHSSLGQVQLIICANSALLLFILAFLARIPQNDKALS